jgi:hypothetical protein
MESQGLLNVGPALARLEGRIDNLGKTDAHHGEQTLEERMNIIEGCISILEGAHLGHSNSDAGEFKGMHGFEPSQIKGDVLQRIEGIQKKLDRIEFLLKDTKVTMSGHTALHL